MEKKFTKGEWKILPEECDRDYIRIRGTALGRRYKICNVLTPVYDNVPSWEAEETRANAKLIAVAPEMYDALFTMVSLKDVYISKDYDHLKEENRDEIIALVKAFRQMEQVLKKATE